MSDRAIDPNLHTGLCNIYIKHYEKCMIENSLMQRLLHGSCDFIKAKMMRCFDEERMEKCRDNRKFQKKLRKEKEEEQKERLRKAEELKKA